MKYGDRYDIFMLRRKGHGLMKKVFGENKKAAYRWRSSIYGHIHFADMNKNQLLTVIKDLQKILNH